MSPNNQQVIDWAYKIKFDFLASKFDWNAVSEFSLATYNLKLGIHNAMDEVYLNLLYLYYYAIQD